MSKFDFTAKSQSSIKFEVCISDNNSKENILPIINFYKKNLKINYKKNNKNFGYINFYKVVKMAKGDFLGLLVTMIYCI